MLRQAFSYCLSTNKRSGFTINQVPLFGPIVGEAFVEEEETGDEEADVENNEVPEENVGQTINVLEEQQHEIDEQQEEQAQESPEETVQ